MLPLSVRDTGVGIAPDKLTTIFDPFTQADASTTRNYGGTGLGLAICRLLVEAMNGTIGVQSDQNGSHFTLKITLPRSAVSGHVAPASESRSERPLEILIAEDNPTNRHLITALLGRLGHHITSTNDGREAVAAVAARFDCPFDLVLMDIQMPVMDGIEATKAIRRLPDAAGRTPIWALTAEDSPERRSQVIAVGMDGILAKPLRMELVAKVFQQVSTSCQRTGPAAVQIPVEPIDHQSFGVFNQNRLLELDRSLGRKSRDELMTMLVLDATNQPAFMRGQVAAGTLDALRRSAHSLRGAALSLGADDLVAALRRLEFGINGQAEDEILIASLEAAAAAVVRAGQLSLQSVSD